MKKISATLFLAMLIFTIGKAQDITAFNFDGITPAFSGWGEIAESAFNPVLDATNSSSNVLKFTHTAQWADRTFNFSIDSRIYTSFSIKVYSPYAGSLSIVCKDAGNNDIDAFNQSVTASTGWTEFTHNLSTTKMVAKVSVRYNMSNAPTGTDADIIYLDDLVFQKSSIATLYYETFWANWSPWGNWTGAPSTVAGQWRGGIDLESTSDNNISIQRYWDSHEHILSIAPGSAAVTISNIDINGFSNLKFQVETSWPWSAGENGPYWGNPDDLKRPVVEIKSGGGSWIPVTGFNVLGAWEVQTVNLPAVDNTLPLSVRFSPNTIITTNIDNVAVLGTGSPVSPPPPVPVGPVGLVTFILVFAAIFIRRKLTHRLA